jgi:hypothetical protein
VGLEAQRELVVMIMHTSLPGLEEHMTRMSVAKYAG